MYSKGPAHHLTRLQPCSNGSGATVRQIVTAILCVRVAPLCIIVEDFGQAVRCPSEEGEIAVPLCSVTTESCVTCSKLFTSC